MRLFIGLVLTLTFLLKFKMAFQQDVCISPRKIFTQSIDQMAFYYDHICEKSFCQGILNFKCGVSHCAKNRKTCCEFLKKPSVCKPPRKKGLKKKKVWNDTGICLNGKGCFLKRVFLMRVRINHMIKKPINCRCKDSFKVACGEKYCALSQVHCKEFNSKLNLSINFAAAKCFNDNQILGSF